jgi:hypothetical protein
VVVFNGFVFCLSPMVHINLLKLIVGNKEEKGMGAAGSRGLGGFCGASAFQ